MQQCKGTAKSGERSALTKWSRNVYLDWNGGEVKTLYVLPFTIWEGLYTHKPLTQTSNHRKLTSKPVAPRLGTFRGNMPFNPEAATQPSVLFPNCICVWFCLKACWDIFSALPLGGCLPVEESGGDDWMGWTEDAVTSLCVDEWSLAGRGECGPEREDIYLWTFSHDGGFVCLICELKQKFPSYFGGFYFFFYLWTLLCLFHLQSYRQPFPATQGSKISVCWLFVTNRWPS